MIRFPFQKNERIKNTVNKILETKLVAGGNSKFVQTDIQDIHNKLVIVVFTSKL